MKFFSGFKEGQKEFGETIAIIVNTILLSLVYFIGLGLTAIISRIFHKDFLEVKINRKTASYWQKLNLSRKPLEEYYRQF